MAEFTMKDPGRKQVSERSQSQDIDEDETKDVFEDDKSFEKVSRASAGTTNTLSSSCGQQTLSEYEYINELKLAAGIGISSSDPNGCSDEDCSEGGDIDADDESHDRRLPERQRSAHNIKNLLEKYRRPDEALDNKPFARLLMKDEFAVVESMVWKRSGWSFRRRWLVLTNKPRIFYTTKKGQYRGMIPWSMTEPISIEKKSNSHFDISIHESSRVYHFNDKSGNVDIWVSVINEISECWKKYLNDNALSVKKPFGAR